MERKKNKIKGMLSKLMSENALLEAIVLSRDGLVVIEETGEKAETVAAMVSVGVASLETAASEWDLGTAKSITVETSRHKMISVGAGPQAILLVSLEKRDTEDLLPKLVSAGMEIEKVLA